MGGNVAARIGLEFVVVLLGLAAFGMFSLTVAALVAAGAIERVARDA